MSRFKILVAVFAFSFLVLSLPAAASAQWRDNRRDDDYYGNNRYNRNLNATIKNLKNRSKQFERRLDRELDRSRYDERRYEDRLNDLAKDFAHAAEHLDKEYDNRGDYRRSQNEARQVLQIGNQLEQALSRARLNYNIQRDWDRIRQDLNILANAYGGYYNDDDYYRNRRGRDDDYRRDRRNRNRGIRFPFPF